MSRVNRIVLIAAIWILGGLVAVPAGFSAEPPETIAYQALLTDASGNPLAGSYSVTFRIYDVASAGTPLWEETQVLVVAAGQLSADLGTTVSLTALPFDVPYYLGVEIETDGEMTPRRLLGTAGYAAHAKRAETVPDASLTGSMIAAQALTPDKLAPVCPEGDYLVMTASGWECHTAACDPQPEVCDGIDNDCNGQVDETFTTLGEICSVGEGVCQSFGVNVCNAFQDGVECSAVEGTPDVEVCDGVDNDCDGSIDNNVDQDGDGYAPVACGGIDCDDTNQSIVEPMPMIASIQPDASIYTMMVGSDVVTVIVEMETPIHGVLDVSLGGLGMTCTQDVLTYTCTYQLNGTEPEGQMMVFASAKPSCGQDSSAVATVILDFTPPTLIASSCNPSTAIAGETVTCLISTSEPLHSTSTVSTTGAAALSLSHVIGTQYEYSYEVTGSEPLGIYTLAADLVDLAGNTALGLAGDDFEIAAACVPQPEVCDGIDNDCNGQVDDGLTGPACSIQDGVCTGSTQTCGGAAGWQPCTNVDYLNYSSDFEVTEISCDGLDNDCDGTVDDVLSAPACANQEGVCSGAIKSCGGVAGWLDCSGTDYASHNPNYEDTETTCDGLDNDCDGQIDDGWLNAGQYDQDTACGNCVTDCTTIYNKPNASGMCDSAGAPVCIMACDSGYFDQNGIPDDGCEFYASQDVVNVSKDDPAAADVPGCGDYSSPCQTISYAINEAVIHGKIKVQVASGLYEEQVVLASGIDLIGGFNPQTWAQNWDLNPTHIKQPAGSGHRKTIVADAINQPTTVQGFVINGTDATTPGANSYVLYAINSDDNLVVTDNKVVAGRGASGTQGSQGASGLQGVDGSPGVISEITGSSPCAVTNFGGSGGVLLCDGVEVSGGKGGNAECPPLFMTQTSAFDGQGGFGPLGGNGGPGGFDARNDCQSGLCRFTDGSYSVDPFDASNGGNGASGQHGSPGLGGGASGTVVSDEWVGEYGLDGASGSHGSGGGGGGAGGGAEAEYPFCDEKLGATGGGGGSGGCGAAAGGGGSPGGGSFGIFVGLSGMSSAPVVTGNQIILGSGGVGGHGGDGGTGGQGGNGDFGGDNPEFCTGGSGRGGDGGSGGHGGGGGGGSGGSAYGIYAYGQGGIDLSAWVTNNTLSGGSGGAGGGGGLSLGNPGSAGEAGTAAATNF